jgi:TM2 domain
MTATTGEGPATNQKFCQDCGGIVSRRAEICPRCGVRQFPENGRSKVTAALFGIFLGSFGVHKFYLGKPVEGMVFCWTFIPGVVGFIEGLVYLSMSDEYFRRKYGYAEPAPRAGRKESAAFGQSMMIRALVALTVLTGLAYAMRTEHAPSSAPEPGALATATSATNAPNSASAAATAAAATEDRHVASPESGADLSAGMAVHILRASLRDPDSLVLESVYSHVPAIAICIEYRAKNGSGGLNREQVAFYHLQLTKNIGIWNEQCAGTGFREVSLSTIAFYEKLIQAKLSR